MTLLPAIIAVVVALATAIVTVAALASAALGVYRMVRGAPIDGCPACGYAGRPTNERRCTECGRTLAQARRAFWRGRIVQTVLGLSIVTVGVVGTGFAVFGMSSLPSWFLARIADPLAREESFPDAAARILHERSVRGAIDPEDLLPVLTRGLDHAIDGGDLFLARSAWPVSEPVRIALRQTTLERLRSNDRLDLVLVAPDGEERLLTRWGGTTRAERGTGDGRATSGHQASRWVDRTISVPPAAWVGGDLRFDVVLRRRDGAGGPRLDLHRRSVHLSISRTTTPDQVLRPVEGTATFFALPTLLHLRHSPAPRDGAPDATIIVWIEPPIPMPATAALGLHVTIEHLEDPPFRVETSFHVSGGAPLLPAQSTPVTIEMSPRPARIGRCRVRVESDASAAAHDLVHVDYVVGRVEFEVDLSQPER